MFLNKIGGNLCVAVLLYPTSFHNNRCDKFQKNYESWQAMKTCMSKTILNETGVSATIYIDI